jgi:hypothetical protein
MRRLLLTMALAPVVAVAQTDVVDLPSIWAPWTPDIKTQCTAAVLNARGDVLAKQPVKFGNVFLGQPLFQATFDNDQSESLQVMAVQLSCRQEGAHFDGEGGWRVRRTAPFVVPPGAKLTVAYSPGFTKGQAAFAIGGSVPKSVSLPSVIASVPPDRSTVDASGNNWSLADTPAAGMASFGVRVLRNGQYRSPWHATLIVNRGGQIYLKNAIDQWYRVLPDGSDIERSEPPPARPASP